jgi:hypothetical protein
VSSQTPARFFFAFSVRTSFEPPANSSANAASCRAFLPGARILEPARGHEVDEEDELAVVGREQEALAAPLGAAEATALERVERRVERLQRGDVRRPCSRDGEGRHRVVKLAPPRLHLRQLGHVLKVAR